MSPTWTSFWVIWNSSIWFLPVKISKKSVLHETTNLEGSEEIDTPLLKQYWVEVSNSNKVGFSSSSKTVNLFNNSNK